MGNSKDSSFINRSNTQGFQFHNSKPDKKKDNTAFWPVLPLATKPSGESTAQTQSTCMLFYILDLITKL